MQVHRRSVQTEYKPTTTMRMRIRVTDLDEKSSTCFLINPNTPFEKLMTAFYRATKQEGGVIFTYNKKRLEATDIPSHVGISDGDVITVNRPCTIDWDHWKSKIKEITNKIDLEADLVNLNMAHTISSFATNLSDFKANELELKSLKMDLMYYQELSEVRKRESETHEQESALRLNTLADTLRMLDEQKAEISVLKLREARLKEEATRQNTRVISLVERLNRITEENGALRREQKASRAYKRKLEQTNEIVARQRLINQVNQNRLNIKQEKINEVEEKLKCVICLDKEKNSMLQPCGHVCVCSLCGDTSVLQTCPICRVTVSSVTRAYVSN